MLSFLESIEDWLLGEFDYDVFSGQSFVSVYDGADSFLQEVLFVLVDGDLHELGSIESDSGSLSEDASGQEELVQEALVDGGEGSTEGSLLGSVLLDPSGVDVSGSDQKDGGFEFFLKLDDEFLVEVGEESLLGSEGDVDEDGWFLLAIGDFDCFFDSHE